MATYGRSQSPLGGKYAPRNAMIEALLRNGVDTSPVQSHTEGIARALTAGLGGLMASKAQSDIEAREAKYGTDMAKVLAGGQAKPWVNPDTGTPEIPRMLPDGMQGPPQMVPTAPAGGNSGMLAALSKIDNPDLAPWAMQLSMADIQNQEAESKRAGALADAKDLYTFQQENKRVDPTKPQTITTAEGIFILNPDGTRGNRLGAPYSAPSSSGGPTAPMQNYAERQRLVAAHGEESPQVRQFDNYVRSTPWQNRGDALILPSVQTPETPTAVIPKGLPPEQTPEVKGAQAEATAGGTVAGTAQATAARDFPQAQANANQLLAVLDKMVSPDGTPHKGLSGVVGMPSISGALGVPGTEEANFQALLDQAKGKQFLAAFESLKGGGVITEVEGLKAEQAIARMQTAQTEAAFMEAVNEFRAIVRDGVTRMARQGGVQMPSAPSAPPAGNSAPPAGIKFLGFE